MNPLQPNQSSNSVSSLRSAQRQPIAQRTKRSTAARPRFPFLLREFYSAFHWEFHSAFHSACHLMVCSVIRFRPASLRPFHPPNSPNPNTFHLPIPLEFHSISGIPKNRPTFSSPSNAEGFSRTTCKMSEKGVISAMPKIGIFSATSSSTST